MPRKLLCIVAALALLSQTLFATWSIIIIDTRTGEIAVASATCLTGFDLEVFLPVVVVGAGAACAQSFVDVTGQNRLLIRNQLIAGTDPQVILAMLAAQDPSHQTRQYGIVDLQGRAVGFTGSGAGAWAGHRTGTQGTLVYAIQGNVLTGLPVVTAAESAVLNTTGDLAAKLLAGMQAARAMGGDGRCSCSPSSPTACGAPPASFTKSADCGFMIVARQGDVSGPCNSGSGCAAGTYYMDLNVANQAANSPDPVLQLQSLFTTWRTSLIGRPDHHLSSVVAQSSTLVANGTSQTMVTVTLQDWQGLPVTAAGNSIFASVDGSSTSSATVGPATSLGGGVFQFLVTSGAAAGQVNLRVSVMTPQGFVLLSPRTPLTMVAPALIPSSGTLSASAPVGVNFQLAGGTSRAIRSYALLASASGSSPGLLIPPASLLFPLNFDAVTQGSIDWANSAILPNTIGVLSPQGQATASFLPPPQFLAPIVGQTLHWAWATLSPVDYASEAVAIAIVP